MSQGSIKVGKRGAIVIPAVLREKYGFKEGTDIKVQPTEQGLLLQPVASFPVEIYTPERKAEFMLNNAVTREEYLDARRQVQEMGLDPESIPHEKMSLS